MLQNKQTWTAGIDYPSFMLDRSLTTLKGGYLLPEETPKDAINRMVNRVLELVPADVYVGDLRQDLFDSIWSGDICASTPVWTNFGTNRGLPISCFGSYVPDSIEGIYGTVKENAKMSQLGGGTSSYWGGVRPRGSAISGQIGSSGGIFEFMKDFNGMISRVSQGGTRRGSHAVYVPFDHADLDEVLEIRKVGCDIQELFYAVSMTKADYEKIIAGDAKACSRWAKILESRAATGIPYIFNHDNANGHVSTPEWYGKEYSKVLASNLCSEIMLPSNELESFVCCLLSMNAANYDRWKQPTNRSVELAVIFMEAVMNDFIIKTTGVADMQRSRRFAERHRALGLGVLGYSTYLQEKGFPFCGIMSTMITKQMFGLLKERAEKTSENLAKVLGNCPFIDEYNIRTGKNIQRRHTTLLAVAPTTSNATIAGGVSPGIEPLASNYYVQKSAKGNFTIVNPVLKRVIQERYPERDTIDTWESIRDAAGSVQHLTWMDAEDKEVFLTFSEINQFELVRLAAVRQNYLDQGQSLNVHIDPDTKPSNISLLYLMGQALGIKAFYYQRSKSVLREKGGNAVLTMDAEACVSCAG